MWLAFCVSCGCPWPGHHTVSVKYKKGISVPTTSLWECSLEILMCVFIACWPKIEWQGYTLLQNSLVELVFILVVMCSATKKVLSLNEDDSGSWRAFAHVSHTWRFKNNESRRAGFQLEKFIVSRQKDLKKQGFSTWPNCGLPPGLVWWRLEPCKSGVKLF